MPVKRGRGRPSKPVIKAPNDITNKVPTNRKKFILHRLRWYMETLEAQIKYDPASIKGKEYIDTVMSYNKACKEFDDEADAKSGMDTRTVDPDRDKDQSTTLGEGRSPELEPGVSAPNPAT